MGSGAPDQESALEAGPRGPSSLAIAVAGAAEEGVESGKTDSAEDTRRARDPELFLVAEAYSDVVAVVMGTYDGRRGWILRLAVHPAHRRQGIAGWLVHELENRFRSLGCPRVNLLVMPDNLAGLRFWQALGYLPLPDVLCSKPLQQATT
ncbi:GNAT family N-acetyltransferase [Microbispora sp. CA-135349]|uniref:GNAT family N-acetyltransferase n=1 Tax=Microbispora sp. CA-135349 TaxID=3239953 RepID=UPI003D8F8946